MPEKNSLWKNIRNKAKENKLTGATPKEPSSDMLKQEKKIKMKSMKYMSGGARKYSNGGGKVDYNKMPLSEAKALMGARGKAKQKGESSFTFNGKTYNVADVPSTIVDHKESQAEMSVRQAKERREDKPYNTIGGAQKQRARENSQTLNANTTYYTKDGKPLSNARARGYRVELYDKQGKKVGTSVGGGRYVSAGPSVETRQKTPAVVKSKGSPINKPIGQKPGMKAPDPAPKAPAKPKSKTTAELWKEKTGTDWSKAKERGLTDGSAKSNLELRKALESGRDFSSKAPEKAKQKTSTIPTSKPKAELQMRKPETKIPEMEPSKEVSFDSPSKMTTRKGKRLEKKANRIAGRKIKKAEAKEGRQMVKNARQMKRGGRR